MTTATTAITAPRVPQDCPVSVVHLRTVTTNGGAHHAAHAFIITDHRGSLVEIISGDDSTEQTVFARWPWFSTSRGRAFGIARQTWPAATVDVSPGEYRSQIKREPWSDDASRLRALADRCQRFSALVDAVNSIRRDGTGEHRLDGPRTADRSGDHVSVYLRRELARLERAGIIERVHEPDNPLTDVYKRYRATDSTPYIG